MDKRRLAHLFQSYPWLARTVVQTYRLTRSRYTAGAIGVLLDDQGRMLLVEHVFHPRNPWGFPGGWVDRLEEPMLTVTREFQEELNLGIQISRPLLIRKSQFWGSHLDMAFLVTSETPLEKMTLSDELMNLAWFSYADLPPLNQFNQMVVDTMLDQHLLSR